MKKKVLFLTAFLPNAAAAAEKNSMILIKELSDYFDVDVVYFKYKNQKDYIPEADNIRVLRVIENGTKLKLINAFMYPIYHPMFTIRYSRSIRKWLQNEVNKNNYSAIVYEHNQMFIYAQKLKTNAIHILYAYDIMAQRIRRASNKLMAAFGKYSERKSFNVPNSYLFTVSKKDSELVREIYHIDSHYALAYIEQQVKDVVPTEIKNEYCFIGKWSRADNLDGVIWFYDKIAPHIKTPITINIIGKDFPKDRISCGNPMVKTNFTGFVDNPYPLIAKCKAMFAPLFTGAGVKQKVFESIACGTPVIGTEIAFEGIPQKYSNMMILANDVDSYLEAMKVDIPLAKRLKIKKAFIEDYTSETIPQFLKRIII